MYRHEVIKVGSMSNSVPNKVRKKAVMTEDIHTQGQSKFEFKGHAIKLCQKIIVEQFDLIRSFKHTTLSPHKFTPVPEKFIQVWNVFKRYSNLPFWGKFEETNICYSLVTDRKYPKNVFKSTSWITNCHGPVIELRVLPI